MQIVDQPANQHLSQAEKQELSGYNKFCDRLEQDMYPYIISHHQPYDEEQEALGENNNGGVGELVELKLPYMAIVE